MRRKSAKQRQAEWDAMPPEVKAYVDGMAKAFATVLSDPRHPFNKLKRPAKRHCMQCQSVYVSRVSMLADTGFCSTGCQHDYQIHTAEMLAQMDEWIASLTTNRLPPIA